MRPHRPAIAVNPSPGDTSRSKAALPTVGEAVATPMLLTVIAECGYEKYAIALPVHLWRRIVRGEVVIIKRLVPVGDAIVPCEWHFNRYRRGNLFVDWGCGDLRFWIELSEVSIRHGEQVLQWSQDTPPVVEKEGPSPSLVERTRRRIKAYTNFLSESVRLNRFADGSGGRR